MRWRRLRGRGFGGAERMGGNGVEWTDGRDGVCISMSRYVHTGQ